MKTICLSIVFFLFFNISFSLAQVAGNELKTEFDTISYSAGVSLGNYLISMGLEEINLEMFVKALNDVYKKSDLILSAGTANSVLNNYVMDRQNEKADKNLKESREFLEKNEGKEGIITLESGLQYQVLTEGKGRSPKVDDAVTTHYRGTLIDGTVFESSYESGEPIKFNVNQVISGWTEALQLMKIGAKWRLFISPELAYGENPRSGGKIEPNMALIFEVELISIEKE